MPRDRVVVGGCPKCQSEELTCSYNFFEKDALTIHTWEHKCPNCGLRDTTAYRSDEEQPAGIDPVSCPYCQRVGSK